MIVRGGVRAFGCARHGDVRRAALELLGGMAAPAVGAAHQLAALACETFASAMSISIGASDAGDTAALAVTGRDGSPAGVCSA